MPSVNPASASSGAVQNTAVVTDNASGDAFGRLRVAAPATIFDSKQINDNQPLFWDEELESGAGITSSHSQDEAATTITSTVSTAGVFTRQTYQRFNYQPGKSQLVLMTGVLDNSGGGTGVQRRIGQFDDDNGMYFEDDEGTVKVVLRSNVTGTPVETKVAQASWNLDPMDGNGPSGVTADWSKTQIFLFDYEWLGVGRVRMGLNIDGLTVYVHEFLHANSETNVYISTPNNPLRYQMVTTGASPASSLKAICTSIVVEGGQDRTGEIYGFSTGATQLNANSAGQLYALLGVRLKSTHIGTTVDLLRTNVLATTNDNLEWSIYLNPVVAGSPTYTDISTSALQGFAGATANTVSGGTMLAAGWASANVVGDFATANARRLGAAIDGTRDVVVLCVRSLTPNADVYGSIDWRELS